MVPLVTKRLGAGRGGGQHHGVPLGQDSTLTPRVSFRLLLIAGHLCRGGQLIKPSLPTVSELHIFRGNHDGQRDCFARLLAERHRFTGICRSLVRDHHVILPGIQLNQVGQRQAAPRAFPKQRSALIPFVGDWLGTLRNHLKGEDLTKVRTASDRLRHDLRRL